MKHIKNFLLYKLFPVCSILLISLFILSLSISIPIYFRQFYYVHIDMLELSEKSGFTENEIRESYNEVLDYLTLPDREFSVGVMRYSDDGKAHFEDCKKLFSLNTSVLLLSATLILLIYIILKMKGLSVPYIKKYPTYFYSGILTLILPAVIGVLFGVNFDFAFTLFHKVLFPGKSNWIFSASKDEIIKVLPEAFFMNCIILVCINILILSAILIISGIYNSKKAKQSNMHPER
ncbi:MAG: TIGR01906 family membrane protein [Oscillospiraceae bacterium]|nr:TIGR01906 family membrane protein [Oscillospiraceae bacterium]